MRLESLEKSKKLKITVGILTATAYFHRRFVESLLRLEYPPNSEVRFDIMEGFQIPFARNRVVEDAFKDNSDYIFFLDSDMVFPPDSLMRLLNHNKSVVNALAFRRQHPHFPAVFKWNKENFCYETIHYQLNSGLTAADATGMACILIKTEVFKKLKKPYYFYDKNLFSSDLSFCRSLNKIDVPIYIDTNLKIGHLGDNKIATEEDYIRNKNPEAIKKYNRLFLKELYKNDESPD